jgi:hypothetical protein
MVACPLEGCVSRFHTHLTGHSAVDRYSLQSETTFWGLSPHHHEMQKQNREIHHVQESCESLTGASHAPSDGLERASTYLAFTEGYRLMH